jgi:hypothetical protein
MNNKKVINGLFMVAVLIIGNLQPVTAKSTPPIGITSIERPIIELQKYADEPSGQGAVSEGALDQIALQYVADREGLDINELIVNSLDAKQYPLTGVRFFRAKVIQKITGETFAVDLDELGNLVNENEIVTAESLARETPTGRISPDLAASLENLRDGDKITVGIWPKVPEKTNNMLPVVPAISSTDQIELVNVNPETIPQQLTPVGIVEEEKDPGAISPLVQSQKIDLQAANRAANASLRASIIQGLKEQMQTVHQPLLQTLSSLNITPTYVSPISPLIYAEVSREIVLALASRPDIDMIYGPNNNEAQLDTAKSTQKADVVDNTFGFDGTGIDVGILERGRVVFDNPDLAAGVTRVPNDNSFPDDNDHATNVGGIVASLDSTFQGIAQDVNLFSANTTTWADANVSAAMDWAATTQDIDVINNSWGSPSGTGLNEHARHLDYISRYLSSTVIVSSGNDPSGGDCATVLNPSRGYNVITVGNYNDNATLTWDDDTMNAGSCFINPDTGVEKPEVAASGTLITSTGSVSPWNTTTYTGTSQAGPMVAGEAALIMDVNSGFEIRPELVKAIIMATALNNIEGEARLSGLDGAGGVDMRAAVVLAQTMPWDYRNVYSSADFPYSINAYVYAGETARAAIAWSSNPSADYTTDPLQADIELKVYDSNGGLVAASTSSNNPFEVVEFTASTSGTYRFEVSRWSFTGTHEQIGLAIWAGNTLSSAGTIYNWGSPPASRHNVRFTPASGWNAIGIRPAGTDDKDISLYGFSAFGDPEDYDQLADSATGAGTVDYVLIDRNHAPIKDYYAEMRNWSGNSNYYFQNVTSVGNLTPGTYGLYGLSTWEILKVLDINIPSGVTSYISSEVTLGSPDLALRLHDSNSSITSTLYSNKNSAVASADAAGAGGRECMSYASTQSDVMGLIVTNKNTTPSNTQFRLYFDTSMPTGSLSINNSAASTTSSNVTLNLSILDSQTGIRQIRFRNSGGSWSAWQSYTAAKAWTLATGLGTRTVNVEVENNACMVTSFSDSIQVIEQFTLNVSTSGNGTVTGSGISCPGDCSQAYDSGTSVTLTASASVGSIFTGWSGACTGTGSCIVGMTAPRSVGAIFVADGVAPVVSSIVRSGANPTAAASVNYTVTFSESVTGVNTGDFNLTTSGVSGAAVSGVGGSGGVYTVTVNTGSSNGTIRLNVADNNSIVDAASNPLGGASVGDGNFTTGEVYTIIKSGGGDTTGVFRPSNGLLYLKNTNATGFADIAINYGTAGDYPIAGDWNGDGTDTIGIYRNGFFYLRNSNTVGFADIVVAFGQPGDQPVAGDWNGDGIDTIGVYRNGLFLLRNSNSVGAADTSFALGNPGDIGIAGDWNGDGMDTTGVFRPSNGIIFLKNANTSGFADIALNYGLSGDMPVIGDWNNDGIDTIGVYRNAQFLLRNSNTIGFAEIVFALGIPGDMPIAGNWDGIP